jgi:fermentation-respiration switch protein FrsA (DUF1100 family)
MYRLGFLLLCLLLLPGCTGVFFRPQSAMVITPAQIGLAYRDIEIPSLDGVRLHAWYLPARGDAKGTVLFLHGNAQNISTHIASVYWLPSQGYNVLLLDYRGYGSSAGKASLEGSMLDIQAAIGWLASRPEVRTRGMAVLGQSLGASMAVYAVAHSPYRAEIRALVIDSAFSGFRSIVREKLADWWLTWSLQWPLSFTVNDKYSPLYAIAAVSPVHLLIIHCEHDRVVPVHHAEELYTAARQPKELWLVAKGGHIQALTQEEQRRRLTLYLDSIFH